MLFLAAFAAALVVDTVPVFAPPAWTILAFIIIKWNANPWGIIAAGAAGSVIGRYILTLYMPHVSAKIFRSRENDNISFLGKRLGSRFWHANAFVLMLTIAGGWMYIHRPAANAEHDNSLLKSGALKEVESAESAYEHAIDKLALQAKPQLENPTTPLLASYHEKLLVLDSAIADLRAQAGMNPSNAQLRYQLLAMYQEKQHTLEEVLEARR